VFSTKGLNTRKLTDEIVLDDPHVVVRGERVLHLRCALR
jgi:hypothetical protein